MPRTDKYKQKPPVHKWDGRKIPVVPPKLTASPFKTHDSLCAD